MASAVALVVEHLLSKHKGMGSVPHYCQKKYKW
jgi:hypothetical protein